MEDGGSSSETEAARVVMAQVVEVLAHLLQRPSRWSGSMELTDSLFSSGIAHLDGRIEITYGIWRQPQYRWRTVIHEALHMYSPAYTKHEYSLARGWEEGVVEQTQRLLRRTILTRLGVAISEKAFAERDAHHEYNGYIEALESLRMSLRMPSLDFYRWLLATPLPDRLMSLKAKGSDLTPPEQTTFRRKLLLAQAKLGRVQ